METKDNKKRRNSSKSCSKNKTLIKKLNASVPFYTGLPLAMMTETGWNYLHRDITNAFQKNHDFKVFDYENLLNGKAIREMDSECTLNFPFGLPILLTCNDFNRHFDLKSFFINCPKAPCQISSWNHKIYIYPTGIVLIEIEMYMQDGKFNLDLDEDLFLPIENHYPELTNVFLRIWRIIEESIPKHFFSSFLCSSNHVQKVKRFIAEPDNPKKRELALDAYYTFVHESNTDNWNEWDVGYVYSSSYFYGQDPKMDKYDGFPGADEPLMADVIRLGYSMFPAMFYYDDCLDEKLDILRSSLFNKVRTSRQDLIDLKKFHIFSQQFATKTLPVKITLDKDFVNALEAFREEYEFNTMTNCLNSQLKLVEEYFQWFEVKQKEKNASKINFLALFFSVISLAAVTAQVIGTVDFKELIDVPQRAGLILASLILGVLCTIVLYQLHKEN